MTSSSATTAAPPAPSPGSLAEPIPGSDGRGGWGVALVAVALGLTLIGGVVLAIRTSQAPPPVAKEQTAEAPAPAADVTTLKDAVAQRPDDVAARLALAHHYFDRSDYDLALAQYLSVLETSPDHVRALARAGWIAFEGGDNATAERLVTAALDRRPQDAEALWFLAHVRLYGLRDPDGARAPLDALLARDDLSREFRLQVRELRYRARR